jgi:2-hydroxychromene-2-carboxylate isomerase
LPPTHAGEGLAFASEVSLILWDGSVKGWNAGGHLAEAAKRAGLDLADLEVAIEADAQWHEERLAENDARLRAAGHWGVPTMVFRGEPFFGQDHFDMLLWRLRQQGLCERNST